MRVRWPILLTSLVVAGATSITALGASAGNYQVRYNAADQHAAQQALLRIQDIGANWEGGRAERVSSGAIAPTLCDHNAAKKSDLVVTGAAWNEWRQPGAGSPVLSGRYVATSRNYVTCFRAPT